jgi:hypothetical protein
VTLVVVPVGSLLYVLVLLTFSRLRRRLDRAMRTELTHLRRSVRSDALTGLGSTAPSTRISRRPSRGPRSCAST